MQLFVIIHIEIFKNGFKFAADITPHSSQILPAYFV